MSGMSSLARKLYTLTVIRSEESLLLGLKKRGFGKGKINGFGGKVEKGETILDAAIREVKEESGVCVANKMRKAGQLDFTFEGEQQLMEVHIFEADGFTGEPEESDEMAPEWHPISSLPYSRMWVDDELWYPMLLRGACFRGSVHFRGQDTILNYDVLEVSQLELEA